MNEYYVYILASNSKILYIGVTNNLERRSSEHEKEALKGFTGKYNVTKLVYYECFSDIRDEIDREKQLKNWHRQWKINLIESVNPKWNDLVEGHT